MSGVQYGSHQQHCDPFLYPLPHRPKCRHHLDRNHSGPAMSRPPQLKLGLARHAGFCGQKPGESLPSQILNSSLQSEPLTPALVLSPRIVAGVSVITAGLFYLFMPSSSSETGHAMQSRILGTCATFSVTPNNAQLVIDMANGCRSAQGT